MIKQNFKLAFVAILTLTFLAGCKKGENDPFLSLKSRNARITGTWKLTSQESTQTDTFDGESEVYSTTFDGVNLTTIDPVQTTTITYSQTIEIKKDGKYKMTRVEDGTTYVNEGSWWWINSKKKKVRIAFDDDWGSYYIDRLKNKEMVLKIDESNSTFESGFSASFTSTATLNFEKE
jgi:hypothetical protein